MQQIYATVQRAEYNQFLSTTFSDEQFGGCKQSGRSCQASRLSG